MKTSEKHLSQGGGHSLFGRWLYSLLWIICRCLAVAVFGFRCRFAESIPEEKGILVLSTHQSHLDPLLLGLATNRRLSSLARSSLYSFKPFGAVITALDAIPINRETSAVKAMKTVIDRLQKGAAVIIFPEGSRTWDGHLGSPKGGFGLIAKKARVPIVPVAIVGAYECWPRTRVLPQSGRIRLEFGRVISVEEIEALSERQLLDLYTRETTRLDTMARQMLSRR